jgi:hypothetical protein
MDNKPVDIKIMSEDEQKNANKEVIEYLQKSMMEGKGELSGLRRQLSSTYWIIIVLYIAMFVVGLVLISVPVVAAFRGQITEVQSLVAAGFGIADLVTLFLSQPLLKMHDTMGDMTQITMVLYSFQSQVGLRLMQMDVNNRETVGKSAENIHKAAEESVRIVEKYFEGKGLVAQKQKAETKTP